MKNPTKVFDFYHNKTQRYNRLYQWLYDNLNQIQKSNFLQSLSLFLSNGRRCQCLCLCVLWTVSVKNTQIFYCVVLERERERWGLLFRILNVKGRAWSRIQRLWLQLSQSIRPLRLGKILNMLFRILYVTNVVTWRCCHVWGGVGLCDFSKWCFEVDRDPTCERDRLWESVFQLAMFILQIYVFHRQMVLKWVRLVSKIY